MALIEFRDVEKSYGAGGHTVRALCGARFSIEKGEFAVILGPSGAGKSTVLNLLGGMDRPSAGAILVDGEDIARASEDRLSAYRRDSVGFVFQFYNLIPSLTALENVALIREIAKNALDPDAALALVGLSGQARQFPAQLSGGEQQRVSIARAIAKHPMLLLCDEPTGALDSETGTQVIRLLIATCRAGGRTLAVVTHNEAIASAADRVIRLRSGRVVEEAVNPAPTRPEEVSL